MNRSIFHLLVILLFIFFSWDVVLCTPESSLRGESNLNGLTYFYYGTINKILLEEDLNLIINNFDNTSFKLVKYLKNNNEVKEVRFKKFNSESHYNIILHPHYYLNYYYSFPFTHSNNLMFYKFFHYIDWDGNTKFQYWRPYVGVYDKNLVTPIRINKFNINPDNYILTTDLRNKIYQILQMYINKNKII